jgi:hypothetical protein
MICPHCKQEAPTVVRGLRAYCTACGAPRSLLSDIPVNLAGQPAKVGGGVAGVLGWIILIFGLLIALAFGALLQVLFAGAVAGYIVGGFLVTVSLLVGLGLIFGGRKLQKSGSFRSQSAHEQAVFTLAKRHGGSLTAAEIAQSLAIPEPDADALLTDMAKRPDGRVTLEVDEDGTLRYFVSDAALGGRGRRGDRGDRGDRGGRVDSGARLRVSDSPPIPDAAEVEARAEAEAEGDEAASQRRTRR